jgi:hypothetical protein
LAIAVAGTYYSMEIANWDTQGYMGVNQLAGSLRYFVGVSLSRHQKEREMTKP